MIRVQKLNVQLRIDESELPAYEARGFSIVDAASKHAGRMQVPPEFEGMDADALKAYAEEKGIPIGNASSVNGILKKIMEAEKA